MTRFHTTVMLVSMPFNMERYFYEFFLSPTLYESCGKNFQGSVLISGVFKGFFRNFWKWYSFYASRKEYSVHIRLRMYCQVV